MSLVIPSELHLRCTEFQQRRNRDPTEYDFHDISFPDDKSNNTVFGLALRRSMTEFSAGGTLVQNRLALLKDEHTPSKGAPNSKYGLNDDSSIVCLPA
jgi:hypothetical protein